MGQALGLAETAKILTTAKRVKDAVEAGAEPDQADLAFLETFQREAEEIGQLEGWSKAAHVAGSLVKQLPAFAGEFIATGGLYRAGAAIGQRGALEAAKRLAKEAVEDYLKRRLDDTVRSTLAEKAADLAIATGVAVARGVTGAAIQAPAALGLRMAGEAAELATTDVGVLRDAQGKLQALIDEGSAVPLPEALARAYGDVLTEVLSERLGGPISVGLTRAAEKLTPEVVRRGLAAAVLNRWLLKNPESSLDDAIRFLRERAAFHGAPIEVLEERAKDLMDELFGIRQWEGIDPYQLAGEAAGFAAFPLAGAGLRRAYSAAVGLSPEQRMRMVLGADVPDATRLDAQTKGRLQAFLDVAGEILPEEAAAVRGLEGWLESVGARFEDGVWKKPRGAGGEARDSVAPEPGYELARYYRLKDELRTSKLTDQQRERLEQAAAAARANTLNGIAEGDVVWFSRTGESPTDISLSAYTVRLDEKGRRVAVGPDGKVAFSIDETGAPTLFDLIEQQARGASLTVQFSRAGDTLAPRETAELSESDIGKIAAVRQMLGAGYSVRPNALDEATLRVLTAFPDTHYDQRTGLIRLKRLPNRANTRVRYGFELDEDGTIRPRIYAAEALSPLEIEAQQRAIEAGLELLRTGRTLNAADLPAEVVLGLTHNPNVTVETRRDENGAFKGYALRLVRAGESRFIPQDLDRIPYDQQQIDFANKALEQIASGMSLPARLAPGSALAAHPAVAAREGVVPINVLRYLASRPGLIYDTKAGVVRSARPGEPGADRAVLPPQGLPFGPVLAFHPQTVANLAPDEVGAVSPVVWVETQTLESDAATGAEEKARLQRAISERAPIKPAIVWWDGKELRLLPQDSHGHGLVQAARSLRAAYIPVQIVVPRSVLAQVGQRERAAVPAPKPAEPKTEVGRIVWRETGLTPQESDDIAFLTTEVPDSRLVDEERALLKRYHDDLEARGGAERFPNTINLIRRALQLPERVAGPQPPTPGQTAPPAQSATTPTAIRSRTEAAPTPATAVAAAQAQKPARPEVAETTRARPPEVAIEAAAPQSTAVPPAVTAGTEGAPAPRQPQAKVETEPEAERMRPDISAKLHEERLAIFNEMAAKATQLGVAVEPDWFVLTVRLLGTYLREGIRRFSESARRTRNEFPQLWAILREHLGRAWNEAVKAQPRAMPITDADAIAEIERIENEVTPPDAAAAERLKILWERHGQVEKELAAFQKEFDRVMKTKLGVGQLAIHAPPNEEPVQVEIVAIPDLLTAKVRPIPTEAEPDPKAFVISQVHLRNPEEYATEKILESKRRELRDVRLAMIELENMLRMQEAAAAGRRPELIDAFEAVRKPAAPTAAAAESPAPQVEAWRSVLAEAVANGVITATRASEIEAELGAAAADQRERLLRERLDAIEAEAKRRADELIRAGQPRPAYLEGLEPEPDAPAPEPIRFGPFLVPASPGPVAVKSGNAAHAAEAAVRYGIIDLDTPDGKRFLDSVRRALQPEGTQARLAVISAQYKEQIARIAENLDVWHFLGLPLPANTGAPVVNADEKQSVGLWFPLTHRSRLLGLALAYEAENESARRYRNALLQLADVAGWGNVVANMRKPVLVRLATDYWRETGPGVVEKVPAAIFAREADIEGRLPMSDYEIAGQLLTLLGDRTSELIEALTWRSDGTLTQEATTRIASLMERVGLRPPFNLKQPDPFVLTRIVENALIIRAIPSFASDVDFATLNASTALILSALEAKARRVRNALVHALKANSPLEGGKYDLSRAVVAVLADFGDMLVNENAYTNARDWAENAGLTLALRGAGNLIAQLRTPDKNAAMLLARMVAEIHMSTPKAFENFQAAIKDYVRGALVAERDETTSSMFAVAEITMDARLLEAVKRHQPDLAEKVLPLFIAPEPDLRPDEEPVAREPQPEETQPLPSELEALKEQTESEQEIGKPSPLTLVQPAVTAQAEARPVRARLTPEAMQRAAEASGELRFLLALRFLAHVGIDPRDQMTEISGQAIGSLIGKVEPESLLGKLKEAAGSARAQNFFGDVWEDLRDEDDPSVQVALDFGEAGVGTLAAAAIGDKPPMPERATSFAGYANLIWEVAPRLIRLRARPAADKLAAHWQGGDMEAMRTILPKIAAYLAIRFGVQKWSDVTLQMLFAAVARIYGQAEGRPIPNTTADKIRSVVAMLGRLMADTEAGDELRKAAEAFAREGFVVRQAEVDPAKHAISADDAIMLLSRLREASESDPVAAFLYAYFALTLNSGLRPGEAARLTVYHLQGRSRTTSIEEALSVDFNRISFGAIPASAFYRPPEKEGDAIRVGAQNGVLVGLPHIKLTQIGSYPFRFIGPEAVFAIQRWREVAEAIGLGKGPYIFAPDKEFGSVDAGDEIVRRITELWRYWSQKNNLSIKTLGGEDFKPSGARHTVKQTALGTYALQSVDRADMAAVLLGHETKGATSADAHYGKRAQSYAWVAQRGAEIFSALPWVRAFTDWLAARTRDANSETMVALASLTPEMRARMVAHEDAAKLSRAMLDAARSRAFAKRAEFERQVHALADSGAFPEPFKQDIVRLLLAFARTPVFDALPRLQIAVNDKQQAPALVEFTGDLIRVLAGRRPSVPAIAEELLHIIYEYAPDNLRADAVRLWQQELRARQTAVENIPGDAAEFERAFIAELLQKQSAGQEMDSKEFRARFFAAEPNRRAVLQRYLHLYNAAEFFAAATMEDFLKQLGQEQTPVSRLAQNVRTLYGDAAAATAEYVKTATGLLANKGGALRALEQSVRAVLSGTVTLPALRVLSPARYASLDLSRYVTDFAQASDTTQITSYFPEVPVDSKGIPDREKLAQEAVEFFRKHGIVYVFLDLNGEPTMDYFGLAAANVDLTEEFRRAAAAGQTLAFRNPFVARIFREAGIVGMARYEKGEAFIRPDVARMIVGLGQSMFSTAGWVLQTAAHTRDVAGQIQTIGALPFVANALRGMFGALGADDIAREVLGALAASYSEYFSDEVIERLATADDLRPLAQFVTERIREARRTASESLFQRFDRATKPRPVPPERKRLEAERMREALNAMIQHAERRGWKKPKPHPPLDLMTALTYLSDPAIIEENDRAIHRAIVIAERVAARPHWMRDNKLTEENAEVDAYDRKTEDPEGFPEGPDPTPEQVRRGLAEPGWEGWKALIEAYEHYSPVTRAFARRLARQYFSGPNARWDLRRLAVAPPEEVEAAFSEFGRMVQEHITTGNPRVVFVIQSVILGELGEMMREMRQRMVDAFFRPSDALPVNASERLRRLIAAGMTESPAFKDPQYQAPLARLLKRITRDHAPDAIVGQVAMMTRDEKREWFDATVSEIMEKERLRVMDVGVEASEIFEHVVRVALYERVAAAEEAAVRQFLRAPRVEFRETRRTPQEVEDARRRRLDDLLALMRLQQFWVVPVEEIFDRVPIGRALPSLREMIRQAFDSPRPFRREYAKAFGEALASLIGDPAVADKAAEVFERAFMLRMKEAERIAMERAAQRLRIPQRQAPPLLSGVPGRRLWRRIQDAVFAGDFRESTVLREIAKQKGVVVRDKDIAELEELANREWQLRQLSKEQLAALEKDHGITANHIAVYLASGSGMTEEQVSAYRRAQYDAARATRAQRRDLHREMTAIWARIIYPIAGAGPFTAARNIMRAVGEISTVNVLFTVSFFRYLSADVFCQSVWAGFYNSLAHATVRAIRNVQRARERGELNAHFIAVHVLGDYVDTFLRYFAALIRNLRVSVLAAWRALRHRSGMPSRIEQLESAVHFFDRLHLRIRKLREKKTARATIESFALSLLALDEIGMRFAASLDAFVFAEFTEPELLELIQTRLVKETDVPPAFVRRFIREIREKIAMERAQVAALAPLILKAHGIPQTRANVMDAIRAMTMGRMLEIARTARPDMDAPPSESNQPFFSAEEVAELERDVARFISVLGWNSPDRSVFGAVIAAPMRWVQEHAARVMIPTQPVTSFANPIVYSVVQTLQALGFGLFPSLFRGSPTVQTEIDQWRTRFKAITAMPIGMLLLYLVAEGIILGGSPPPDDPEEKAKLEKLGASDLDLAIPYADGKYLILPGYVGPLAILRGYVIAGSVIKRVRQRQEERLKRAARIATETGMTVDESAFVRPGELISEILNALSNLAVGARTAIGKVGPLGVPAQAITKTAAARYVSSKLPFLPLVNSIMREIGGVNYDSRLSSFASLVANFMPGGKQRLNFLGEPVNSERDVKAILQRLTVRSGQTGDMFTGPNGTVYYNTVTTGFMPPKPDPNRLFVIGGKVRKLTEDELASFLKLRGRFYAENVRQLGPLGPGRASELAMERAYRAAEAQALAVIGAAPARLRRGPVGSQAAATGGAARTTAALPATSAGFLARLTAPGRSASVTGPPPPSGVGAPTGRIRLRLSLPRLPSLQRLPGATAAVGVIEPKPQRATTPSAQPSPTIIQPGIGPIGPVKSRPRTGRIASRVRTRLVRIRRPRIRTTRIRRVRMRGGRIRARLGRFRRFRFRRFSARSF